MKKISFISRFWEHHPLETIGISISIFCCILATIFLFVFTSSDIGAETLRVEKTLSNSESVKSDLTKKSEEIYTIEISGAVVKPDIYTVRSTTRIKSAIELAGGLNTSADAAFVSRNFNLTLFVTDGQKIHIPSYIETSSGIFKENARFLEYLETEQKTNNETPISAESDSIQKVSINNATAATLDTLPGVGPATADKIIAGRPYGSIEELVGKKILSDATLRKIQDELTL